LCPSLSERAPGNHRRPSRRAAGLARYDELLRAWVNGLPQGKLVDIDSGHDIQWEMPGSVITETELVLGDIR
jgi:hypothetical protein